jgi:hypothetical protein
MLFVLSAKDLEEVFSRLIGQGVIVDKWGEEGLHILIGPKDLEAVLKNAYKNINIISANIMVKSGTPDFVCAVEMDIKPLLEQQKNDPSKLTSAPDENAECEPTTPDDGAQHSEAALDINAQPVAPKTVEEMFNEEVEPEPPQPPLFEKEEIKKKGRGRPPKTIKGGKCKAEPYRPSNDNNVYAKVDKTSPQKDKDAVVIDGIQFVPGD